MSQFIKCKVHAFVALLFSAVLLVFLLVKPVHILFVSHDRVETLKLQSDFGVFSNSHHNCSVCNFEFCSFIPQAQVHIPKADISFAQKITPQTIDRIIKQTSHHFQLRGPPVL
jgi:hypothetical protein